MFSRKGKEIDKRPADPSSSTHTRRPCSTKASNGKHCPGDGKYDSSNGKICRTCYDKTHRRARVGSVASSSRTQKGSSHRSSPSVSLQSSTAQKLSHRRIETGTQSHDVRAPSKRRASRTPSSGAPSPKRYPVSPDPTGFGTSEGLESSPSLQSPAYGQVNYNVEYEKYQPPRSPYHPMSPNFTGTYSPGLQTSGFGVQQDPAEYGSYKPPEEWRPRSPDLTGFTIPETEPAPRVYATSVVEQSSMQSLDTQQTQYPNRDYDEGDLYSADTPPREIQQTQILTRVPRRRDGIDSSRAPAARPEQISWESGSSSQRRAYISPYSRTTNAGGESSSGFNRMPNVSEILSQMHSTSIDDPNVLAISDVRGSYDQILSTSHANLSPGAVPSFVLFPEVAQGVLKDGRWEYEQEQWALNEYQMRRRYLDQYPANNPVSERPDEFRAHLLFAMSLGEGLVCTYRERGSRRCKKKTVAAKRYFYCDKETHNDQNNDPWFRGMIKHTRKIGLCYQIVKSHQGVSGTSRRQCSRLTNSTYCDLEDHDEKYLNVPQPRYHSYRG